MTQGNLIKKKNMNSLIGNSQIKSGIMSSAQKDIDQQLEGFYKTEDNRGKSHLGHYDKPLMTKNERDDMVSNYFSDKRKLKQ